MVIPCNTTGNTSNLADCPALEVFRICLLTSTTKYQLYKWFELGDQLTTEMQTYTQRYMCHTRDYLICNSKLRKTKTEAIFGTTTVAKTCQIFYFDPQANFIWNHAIDMQTYTQTYIWPVNLLGTQETHRHIVLILILRRRDACLLKLSVCLAYSPCFLCVDCCFWFVFAFELSFVFVSIFVFVFVFCTKIWNFPVGCQLNNLWQSLLPLC